MDVEDISKGGVDVPAALGTDRPGVPFARVFWHYVFSWKTFTAPTWDPDVLLFAGSLLRPSDRDSSNSLNGAAHHQDVAVASPTRATRS